MSHYVFILRKPVISINTADDYVEAIKDFSVDREDFELLEATMNLKQILNKRRVTSVKQKCLKDYFVVENR